MDNETKMIIFAIALVTISIILGTMFTNAEARIDIDNKLEELEERGFEGCEVWQIYDFFYAPADVELRHDPARPLLDIKFDDDSSEPEWRGDPEKTIFRTNNFTDNYVIEVILDYNSTSDELREVTYEIHTDDGKLTHEGNWFHSGDKFCKVIAFSADTAPSFPTPAQITTAQEAKFSEQLDDIEVDQEQTGNKVDWLMIVSILSATFVGVVAAIVLSNSHRVQKGVKEPMEKYSAMNKKFNNLVKNVQMIGLQLNKDKNQVYDMIKNVVNNLDKSYEGLLKTREAKARIIDEQNGLDDDKVKSLLDDNTSNEELEANSDKSFVEKFTSKLKFGKDEKVPTTQTEWVEHYKKYTREELEDERNEIGKLFEKEQTEEIAMRDRACYEVLLEKL